MSEGKYVFVYYKEFSENVTCKFKSFLDDDLYIDLVFVCAKNKKVGAHQIVLGCLSKFFYSIFIENASTMKEKVLHIYVPDIRAKMMKHILQFIYSGKTMLSEEELQEFNEDIKLLGMPLDNFSGPSETTENNEISHTSEPVKTSQNSDAALPRVPGVVSDTVDLTDTSINEDEEQGNGNSNNTNELPNQKTSEATHPISLPIASNADTNVTSDTPAIDKNPTDNKANVKSSLAENRTTPTSLSSSPDVRRVPENESKLKRRVSESNVKSEPTVRKVSQNNINSETSARKIVENTIKKPRKTSNEEAKPKRTKYLTALIDLDGSDDDDVIAIPIS